MRVPFSDPAAQSIEAAEGIDAAWQAAVSCSAYIGGEPVRQFEAALAASFGVKHACGVASGTAALTLVLKSLALKPGDEVITTVHTAAPTAEAIAHAGGRIVFCDIEEETFQVDPVCIEAAITPRTRAILPIHLYGMAVRLREIMSDCGQT